MNKTVRFGDREVARMGLGTNRLTQTPANVELLSHAAAASVGLIDTAHLYTGGASESTIGAAFDGRTPRPFVATKGGFGRGEGRPEVLRSQIEESLRRLRFDRIDLYYLHRVDPETPLEDSVGTLAEYRQRGVIEHIGLSQVGIDQIERARQVVPITAVQNHYNIDERGWDDVVSYCEREGIVFVPFYPLHGDRPELRDIARRHDATPSQIALAWLLRRSPVMLPIPGTLSVEHMLENVAALDIELTDDEFAALS